MALWAHTDSNRGPLACKANALNQLSYAPDLKTDCKHSIFWLNCKIKELHSFEVESSLF